MSRLRVYYSPEYAPQDSPLLFRLAVTAGKLQRLCKVELRRPRAFNPDHLKGLHSENYLHAFYCGREPLASSQGIPWSPSVRNATLAMLSGQLEGAAHALENGIAMNLARGFHHAVRDRGAGFCPLNGLALVAHCMPHKKVFVLDCDEHGGNGTEEFAAEIPNLFNFSIFGTRFGCRGGSGSWALQVPIRTQGFDAYLSALLAARDVMEELRPDLILYQAGADCHARDPKSQLRLSTRELYRRDLVVFDLARRMGIPILFLVAGGYQDPEQVARLNVNTARAAQQVYGGRGFRGGKRFNTVAARRA